MRALNQQPRATAERELAPVRLASLACIAGALALLSSCADAPPIIEPDPAEAAAAVAAADVEEPDDADTSPEASMAQAQELLRHMRAQRVLDESRRTLRAEPAGGASAPDAAAIAGPPTPSSPGGGESPAADGKDEFARAFDEISRAAGLEPSVPPPAVPAAGPPPEPVPAPSSAPGIAAAPDPAAAGAPVTRSPTAQEGAPQEPPPAAAPADTPAQDRPARPAGKTQFYSFFHKTGADFINFLRDDFGDLVAGGHVAAVRNKPRSVLLFGDDAMIASLSQLADEFDDLGLDIQRATLRPRFVNPGVVIESLTMAGLCNVWTRVEETITTQQQVQQGKFQTIATHKHSVYAQGSIANGQQAPLPVSTKVPYVFEMPWTDPYELPRQSTGKAPQDSQLTIDFRNPASTESRGVVVAVGTAEDIERITAFVDSIDRPARQVMIEVQVVELRAEALTDIGIDSIQTGSGHNLLNFAGPLPGEPLTQPGIPGARAEGQVVPPVVNEGLAYLFDDTSIDLSGRFIANIHYLVRTGDAKIKARPKILTLDDRSSILHIGEEVPSFASTGVTRDATNGNLISEVNQVTTQYVGFTLNMRPKISGEDGDEIALQIEVVVNQLQGRERVFEEDLAGIPIVARRQFTGQPRVKNHRPIILGGLITEEEVESSSKVPVIGEIPYIGNLFSRTQKEKRRLEVILIVTPHILSETGVDNVATPKESAIFDTFDSVLFNDRHIVKGRDVWGIDPITKLPAMVDGELFTEQEVIDLTLLNIVKQRELVSKLNIFDEYLPDEAAKLSWIQRRFPERSVYYWPEAKKEVYFKAAAIVIENIKELNHPLRYDDIVVPRREIVLPTTPYRMTLSYDKYKTIKERGAPVLRGQRVELSEATVNLLRDAALQRTVRHFADFVRRNDIDSERHGELRSEMTKLYRRIAVKPPDGLEALGYAEFLDELGRARIDFVALAAFFQEGLEDRYRTTGRPDIGAFETDMAEFLKSSVTITQRAKRLLELEDKWNHLASDSDAEGAGEDA